MLKSLVASGTFWILDIFAKIKTSETSEHQTSAVLMYDSNAVYTCDTFVPHIMTTSVVAQHCHCCHRSCIKFNPTTYSSRAALARSDNRYDAIDSHSVHR